MEELKYPVGRYEKPADFTPAVIELLIHQVEQLPQQAEDAVKGLNDAQLETPYRPGGWTVRQVVHHLADSHMNAFIRFKLALTEHKPLIKPYSENEWAQLIDVQMPLRSSLDILKGVHERWVMLLKSLDDDQWKRSYIHPEYGKEYDLQDALGSYAWHGRHHLAHIELGKKAAGLS